MTHKSTIAVVSGGLDSVTMAYMFAGSDGLTLLSFDYGQKHRKELDCARLAAHTIGVEHVLIDLRGVGSLIATSALTSDLDVPEGHYAEETMRQTIVPGRNAMMLAIAGSICASRGGGLVATAVHAGDHFIYPDCRPHFIDAMSLALSLGSDGIADVSIEAPFLDRTKTDIVRLGRAGGVPFADTWSCYVGGDIHCGVCGTCTERREAFELADVDDPTAYADLTKHW